MKISDAGLLLIYKQACNNQSIFNDLLDIDIIKIMRVMYDKGGIPISLILTCNNDRTVNTLIMCTTNRIKQHGNSYK